MTRLVVFLFAVCFAAPAQQTPAGADRLRFSLDFRSRFEARTGVGFGSDPNIENPLFRTRVGADFKPVHWLKLSAMAQDSRAPLYGRPAPSNARDTLDLQEGYIELAPGAERGFGALVGRKMFALGDGRVFGEANWANASRTFDTARIYWRHPQVRVELLLVSIVRVRTDDFNQPVIGDRVWGVYNSFPHWIPKGTVDLYALRHDQNRPGGFTGNGRLGVNTFGGRAAGPMPADLKYSVELIGEAGKFGASRQRAFAAFGGLSRRIPFAMPLDLSGEYKFASRDYDLLYTAIHDRFGHADLFGWRNIHNVKLVGKLNVTKKLAFNLMFNDNWLADTTAALYDPRGRVLAQAALGSAGRHVGREADLFATLGASRFQFGAGFAHLFAGEFLRRTTPGVNTRYLYVFQSFSW